MLDMCRHLHLKLAHGISCQGKGEIHKHTKGYAAGYIFQDECTCMLLVPRICSQIVLVANGVNNYISLFQTRWGQYALVIYLSVWLWSVGGKPKEHGSIQMLSLVI